MNCSLCGNALSPSAKFCKHCGSKQVLAPEAAPANESPTPATEKICGQCQAICKPLARFCPQCGNSFAVAAAATTPQPAVHLPEANIVVPPPPAPSPTPARQEPVFQAAAADIQPSIAPSAPVSDLVSEPVPEPVPGFLPPAPDKHAFSAPAFPQEPQRSNRAWIKWSALALVAAAIAGGILLASNMSAFPGSSGNPSTPVPAVDKNAISAEDKARADALVGPQGATAKPVDPSTTIVVPPDAVTGGAASTAPAPAMAPQAPAIPVQGMGADSSQTRPVEAPAPAPRPVARPKPQPKGPPSLDDLLD